MPEKIIPKQSSPISCPRCGQSIIFSDGEIEFTNDDGQVTGQGLDGIYGPSN